ncbi:3-beta hydroxysteroid dehydrogenase [Naasia aerilata]|uniref:3-beta hydroxysteroid dehydrogenase n=1 Tax=Naasia aerilata TaxID=1162966 RepID=A0ABM8G8C6_9MICO|nr:3-beta hydroxysteroid dehydrogenase [Naasia aerilata]
MAGATGAVGVHVVAALAERGVEVVPLTRGAGVDLLTGSGLDGRLDGCDAVVDVASVQTLRTKQAVEYFTRSTENLLAAEAASGVGHHLALSIVGIDGAEVGYYAGKVAQERAVVGGSIPWTILRATQFHEFADQLRARGRLGPVIVVPTMTIQPVAAVEVGAALADAVLAGPSGRIPDLAGPRVEQLADLVRRCERAPGARTPVFSVPMPRLIMRTSGLLAGPGARLGKVSFDEWLAGRTRD